MSGPLTPEQLDECIAIAKGDSFAIFPGVLQALQELRELRAKQTEEGLTAREILSLMSDRLAVETAVTMTAIAIADWLRVEGTIALDGRASSPLRRETLFNAANAIARGEWRPKPPTEGKQQ